MIYIILFIMFLVILGSTKMTLNRQYGKISDNPLRKKIVDDTINLILFAITFWCFLQMHSKTLPILSLLTITLLLFLFLQRGRLKRLLLNIIDKLRQKIAFSAKLIDLIRRSMKNWKISPKDSSKGVEYNSSYIYRERILLTIIFFCKRAMIMAVIILGILKLIEITNPTALQILLSHSEDYLPSLEQLFVHINNIGLVFTCWKFKCDYKNNDSADDDDPRYITLMKRLLRNEHEI